MYYLSPTYSQRLYGRPVAPLLSVRWRVPIPFPGGNAHDPPGRNAQRYAVDRLAQYRYLCHVYAALLAYLSSLMRPSRSRCLLHYCPVYTLVRCRAGSLWYDVCSLHLHAHVLAQCDRFPASPATPLRPIACAPGVLTGVPCDPVRRLAARKYSFLRPPFLPALSRTYPR